MFTLRAGLSDRPYIPDNNGFNRDCCNSTYRFKCIHNKNNLTTILCSKQGETVHTILFRVHA